MKKLSLILFLLLYVSCYSQEIAKPKNIAYLDLGIIITGSSSYAFGVGLNYERMLNDNLSIRAGMNIAFYNTHIIGDEVSGTSIGFPITLNYMTNSKNKFEVGLGGGPRISLTDENSNIFFPAARIGYRYQPDETGMIYRLGIEVPSNVYISLGGVGYQFK